MPGAARGVSQGPTIQQEHLLRPFCQVVAGHRRRPARQRQHHHDRLTRLHLEFQDRAERFSIGIVVGQGEG
jgi:hypothetical protein